MTEMWSLIVVISSSQISNEGSKYEVWYWNKKLDKTTQNLMGTSQMNSFVKYWGNKFRS